MEELITGSHNQIVKLIRALRNKKQRDRSCQYFVEGCKLVQEALNERAAVSFLVVSNEFDWEHFREKNIAKLKGLKPFMLDAKLFENISDVQTPQGIIAVIERREDVIEQVLSRSSFFLVVLDEIQDPGNVGTIIRTLDAAGGDGLVLLKGCADPYSPKAIRATMGSVFRIPIFEVEDHREFFNRLKQRDVHIMVGHLHGTDLFKWSGKFQKTVLVMGNESVGVKTEICEAASSLVKIPMRGGAESLNVSVAAGLLIYEVIRKKRY